LLKQAAELGLDLLFPPACVGCHRVGSLLCPKCVAAIIPVPARVIPSLDAICAAGAYESPLSDAVQALKYHGATRLAGPLGALLATQIAACGWEVDLVCPVPLHPNRVRERGYNQAALIGAAIARTLGCPAIAAAERLRDTPSQTHLSARERRDNMAGAFGALPAARGQRVLLVDDVLTTGATLSACAAALRDAGAALVYGGAIAAAVLA
jgi:ComF family protein